MDASMTYASARMARRTSVLAAFFIFSVGVSGCNKLKARDLLNKGVVAFKAGKSDDAIEDFKRATELDPSLTTAHLYLATAYASLYIPGAPSAENKARGEQAIKVFKEILDTDSNNLSAIDGIGSLVYQMAGTGRWFSQRAGRRPIAQKGSKNRKPTINATFKSNQMTRNHTIGSV